MTGRCAAYGRLLERIYGLGRFGMTPGLDRIRPLLRNLDDPQDAFAAVHVAGTNGKGSTASFLAALLRETGLRVGLFTSPHLVSFTERFRVDGDDITEERLALLAERVLTVAPPATTFFEVATAIACLHFAEEGVSLAVLEVGMGGRFDATNAVDGILSVITPIALDHCEYLGDSLGRIAAEKAGVIRPGRPVIVGPQAGESMSVIAAHCRELGSGFLAAERDFDAFWEPDGLRYQDPSITLAGLRPGIGGRYQSSNAACAIAAARSIDGGISPELIRRGIAGARWPGRMELFQGSPRILLDGAHNPAGAAALALELEGLREGRRLLLVVGIMGDKDLQGVVAPLKAIADVLVAVAPSLDRAMPATLLAERIGELGGGCLVGGSVENGLALARSLAGPDDLVVVCGSLFTVGEARALLTGGRYEPVRG